MDNTGRKKYRNPVVATVTGIRDLFRERIPAGELKPTDRLDGKTVLVDGASSGLGFAVAVEVARRGARVIMACRSGIPGKGEEVKRLSGNPHVGMVPVEFADIDSMKQCIRELKVILHGDGAAGGVDIYVCNAGIVPKKSRRTPQGLEEMFMVNYFSKYLFVNMLLQEGLITGFPSFGEQSNNRTIEQSNNRTVEQPNNRIIKQAIAGQPSDLTSEFEYSSNRLFNKDESERVPRILFVASESHRNPDKFEWESFGAYRDFTIGKSMENYGQYKLMLTTFAVELSRRLNPGGKTNFSVFALCPGPVNSNIAREAPKIFHPLMKLVFGIFFRSPARAAIPVVYLAASPDVEGKAFDYLFLMSRKEVDEKASDPQNGTMLWNLSEMLRNRLEAVPQSVPDQQVSSFPFR